MMFGPFAPFFTALLLGPPGQGASDAACRAEAGHYRLAGNRAVTATLRRLPEKLPEILSDLYLRVDMPGRDPLWFAMDRGGGHGETLLHASSDRLDRPLPAPRRLREPYRTAIVTFFDARSAALDDIVTTRDAAPQSFRIAPTEIAPGPDTAPGHPPAPALLSQGSFVLDGCGA